MCSTAKNQVAQTCDRDGRDVGDADGDEHEREAGRDEPRAVHVDDGRSLQREVHRCAKKEKLMASFHTKKIS